VSDDVSKRPEQPQPLQGVPAQVLAKAREQAALAREVIGTPATEIEPARSGLLSPPHSPSDHSEGDQAGGAARVRHPGEAKPLPSPSEIGRNPKAYLPPQPAHGRDTGRER
jgi:hypothetical protein